MSRGVHGGSQGFLNTLYRVAQAQQLTDGKAFPKKCFLLE